MADLQCRLQEAVDANREVLNARGEERRTKAEITASRQQQAETAKAQRGTAAKPSAGEQPAKAQSSAQAAGGVERVQVSQRQALEAAFKKGGVARLRDTKRELSFRRDTGLLEPIYVVQYGDDTLSSYENRADYVTTRPDQGLFVFRGDTLISAVQPMSTAPFDLAYATYNSNAYANAIQAITGSGGFVTAEDIDPSFNQWFSFKVNEFMVVDQRLVITYCRGVRVFDRQGYISWRKPDWFIFESSEALAHLTLRNNGPSYVYFDFATYEVDLIDGGVQGAAAPFLQYQIQSTSARVVPKERTFFNGYINITFHDDYVEQTYARSVTQRKPSEALAETLGDVHPARNCNQDFWEIESGFELLPISSSGGIRPTETILGLNYELLYGPPWQPDDYIAGIRPFPTQITSANTSEGLKVVTDASGVGELGSIDLGLQNCSDLRLAFGLYSRSFEDYTAAAVEDFDGAFYTENISEQALTLFQGGSPPSSIT
ncbi:MAG: hypothetical protein EBU42_09525, partial [Synechococcus sp.]|nr:hypothetical protein [Synechococcus sp.]